MADNFSIFKVKPHPSVLLLQCEYFPLFLILSNKHEPNISVMFYNLTVVHDIG